MVEGERGTGAHESSTVSLGGHEGGLGVGHERSSAERGGDSEGLGVGASVEDEDEDALPVSAVDVESAASFGAGRKMVLVSDGGFAAQRAAVKSLPASLDASERDRAFFQQMREERQRQTRAVEEEKRRGLEALGEDERERRLRDIRAESEHARRKDKHLKQAAAVFGAGRGGTGGRGSRRGRGRGRGTLTIA